MKWLKAKKGWLKDTSKCKHQDTTDPMKARAPFHKEYDYSYGAPYEGSSYDEYSKGEGTGKIKMDPEKYVGLGLGKGT